MNRSATNFIAINRPPLGRLRGLILMLLAGLTLSVTAVAAEPVSKSRLGGTAIGGHDTVAYHSLQAEPQEKAQKGAKAHIVKWKGAKWRFATKESADLFRASPEKYSPAYNGFCANALSLGKGLLRTDGTHWEIFGDQLYLFYAAKGRDRWMATDDISDYVAEADTEWARLSAK